MAPRLLHPFDPTVQDQVTLATEVAMNVHRNRRFARYYLTPEGWVAAPGSTETGAAGWQERPARTVETWEWDPPGPSQTATGWRRTWVAGHVDPAILDGIRTSFPHPVDQPEG